MKTLTSTNNQANCETADDNLPLAILPCGYPRSVAGRITVKRVFEILNPVLADIFEVSRMGIVFVIHNASRRERRTWKSLLGVAPPAEPTFAFGVSCSDAASLIPKMVTPAENWWLSKPPEDDEVKIALFRGRQIFQFTIRSLGDGDISVQQVANP
jgi:hypothetical protein